MKLVLMFSAIICVGSGHYEAPLILLATHYSAQEVIKKWWVQRWETLMKNLRGYIKEKRIVMRRDDGRRVISEFTSILCGGEKKRRRRSALQRKNQEG